MIYSLKQITYLKEVVYTFIYMYKNNNTMPAKDKMFSLRIPEKLLNEYRQFCEENSINISKRLRKFIERDLEIWKQRKSSFKDKNI
jgi:hypothetical protein